MEDKFLYIKDDNTEGTLLAQDGGVAIIWHNGEYILAQCYRERLEARHIKKGLSHAFDEMAGISSNSSMLDFEEDQEVQLGHIKEMAEWLVAPLEGDFFDNLTIIDVNEVTKKELDKQVKEFFNNPRFEESEKESLVDLLMEHKFSDDIGNYQKNLKKLNKFTLKELRVLAKPILSEKE
jgi:hypothetical protein